VNDDQRSVARQVKRARHCACDDPETIVMERLLRAEARRRPVSSEATKGSA
jgi:hypothetical protein